MKEEKIFKVFIKYNDRSMLNAITKSVSLVEALEKVKKDIICADGEIVSIDDITGTTVLL